VRVFLVTQVPPAAHAVTAMLRSLGHEPVALLCSRVEADRYGSRFDELVRDAPEGLDVLVPATKERIAPLVRAYEPDLLFCVGFPWRIPEDALAVPRLGAVNAHAAPLPKYRGPFPFAWAVRNGDAEIGMTLHRMEPDFDTGPILAQGGVPLDDEQSLDELGPKLERIVAELLPIALGRVARGDPGDPQRDEDASYAGAFEPEYAQIDWSRRAADIHRQVRAWRFMPGDEAPVAELEGREVHVVGTRLEPGEATPVECGDGTIWVVETKEVAAA
jgi:methionyl-tRNA formyltransferase